MEVKCIISNDNDLTFGKIYKVNEEFSTHYLITGDRYNVPIVAPKYWFKNIKLERKLKIENIFNKYDV